MSDHHTLTTVNRTQTLDLLMLLSAMESHVLAHKVPYPLYLAENLNSLVGQLRYDLINTTETSLITPIQQPHTKGTPE